MKNLTPIFAGFLVAAISGLLGGAESAAQPMGNMAYMVGHRAVYDIRLETASSGSGVVSAGGEMIYRAERYCGGWASLNNTTLRLNYDDGEAGGLQWSYAASEGDKPRTLHTRVLERGGDGEAVRVTAKAWLSSSGGEAEFSSPETLTKTLPEGTRFPIHSLADLLAEARAGKHQIAQVTFDGATTDNPYRVFSAVYGPVPEAKRKALARKFALDDRKSWRIRMGMFPVGSRRDLPEFEVEADYREDGIATDILQDFGDFALRLTVRELEILAAPDCQ